MEGIIKRLWILSALMVAGIAAVAFTKGGKTLKIDETWMEGKLPIKVGNYEYLPASTGAKQSYKMDDRTYKELAPYGIVARIFRGQGRDYDVVIIASDSKESFHDPAWCFGSQGFNFVDLGDEVVQTKSRGAVPIKVVNIGRSGKEKQIAAYTYKGPGGFYASMQRLKKAMLVESLRWKPEVEGVFYRFIPADAGTSKEELLMFIAQYMDAAKQTSDGFF